MTRPVILRPSDLSDVEALVSWSDDEVFRARAGWSDQPIQDRRAFWSKQVNEPSPSLIRLAAIFDGAIVGYVDLHGEDEASRELGFVVGPSSRWGHGLGG